MQLDLLRSIDQLSEANQRETSKTKTKQSPFFQSRFQEGRPLPINRPSPRIGSDPQNSETTNLLQPPAASICMINNWRQGYPIKHVKVLGLQGLTRWSKLSLKAGTTSCSPAGRQIARPERCQANPERPLTGHTRWSREKKPRKEKVRVLGLEPRTNGLKVRCSTN